MGHKGSFATVVRTALNECGMARIDELLPIVNRIAPDRVVGRKIRPMVMQALRDLVRFNEAACVDGWYRMIPRKDPVQIRQKMWSILRSRRLVSIEDLMELTGAGREYARQWLGMLAGHEIVARQDDGRFRLVQDTVEQPDNDVKAEKLRQIRRKKALQNMGKALEGVVEAWKTLEAEL